MNCSLVRVGGCLILAGFVAACSAPVDIGASSGAGKKFHDEYNQQKYAEMYAEADVKFRAAVKPEDWTKLLTRVHDKLGNETDATRIGFNVNYNVGGSTVTMTYSTKFQLGEGTEEFVWLKSGDGVRLLHYNIRSPAFDESNVQ
jgi:NAD dependent epimerase/dehydratase family enzyme